MFSQGQIIFASLFAVTFIAIIAFSYKKDKKIHLKNYKGVKWVGIFFIAFLVLLLLIKFSLK